jgi:hypothetical protein
VVARPQNARAVENQALALTDRQLVRTYEEDKRRRMGPEADRPHRMSYKKLTR